MSNKVTNPTVKTQAKAKLVYELKTNENLSYKKIGEKIGLSRHYVIGLMNYHRVSIGDGRI